MGLSRHELTGCAPPGDELLQPGCAARTTISPCDENAEVLSEADANYPLRPPRRRPASPRSILRTRPRVDDRRCLSLRLNPDHLVTQLS
jgi:hypothetical protein